MRIDEALESAIRDLGQVDLDGLKIPSAGSTAATT